jgi:hypothetical protein
MLPATTQGRGPDARPCATLEASHLVPFVSCRTRLDRGPSRRDRHRRLCCRLCERAVNRGVGAAKADLPVRIRARVRPTVSRLGMTGVTDKIHPTHSHRLGSSWTGRVQRTAHTAAALAPFCNGNAARGGFAPERKSRVARGTRPLWPWHQRRPSLCDRLLLGCRTLRPSTRHEHVCATTPNRYVVPDGRWVNVKRRRGTRCGPFRQRRNSQEDTEKSLWR